jgi:Holliday junction resolvase RusA-like endonuclease
MYIKIDLEPITKKNHQEIRKNWKTGRRFIGNGDAYLAYQDACAYYIKQPEKPYVVPVNVKALFYMKTKRRCDLVNLQEALLDILVKYNVLSDDNYTVVESMDGSRVLYDKEHPRTEIWIEPVDELSVTVQKIW